MLANLIIGGFCLSAGVLLLWLATQLSPKARSLPRSFDAAEP